MAAEAVFSAHGYAATTVDEVAENAGISKGSIYNYFQNKQDLFHAVFSEAVKGMESDALAAIGMEGPAAQTMEKLLDIWFGRLPYYQQWGRLVLEFWSSAAREGQAGQMTATFRSLYSRWRTNLASVIEKGIRAGEFRAGINASASAALILASLDGIQIQTIIVGLVVDASFAEELKRSILSGLSMPGNAEGA